MFTAALLLVRDKSVLVATVILGMFVLALLVPVLFVLLSFGAFVFLLYRGVQAIFSLSGVKRVRAWSIAVTTACLIALVFILPVVLGLP
ncbi:MAG: hypothetical protein IPK17_01550 [Chloroflexi bacterium]|uniref:hypothetical protein n=1 Tax=Candidatus Flexifilum breve TaxID=3140694 RepID=UPI0031363DBD|nr:hypothetical protein [Chloroflexota bacterium]